MDSGVPGTLCPIDPGPGESFWFFKFSWAVLLLSGPNAEHRPGVQSPCTGLGVWSILVEVQWGTHTSLLRGRLGLGSHECWVPSTLPRDPPQSGQGQYLMLVTQQLLG